MIRLLLLAFLLDLAVLIWMGAQVGPAWVIVVVLVTASLGVLVIKHQGAAMWWSARRRLASGSMPGHEIAHGAMIVAAGALLLAPGPIADAAGLVLLVRPVREWLRRRIAHRYRPSSVETVRVELWR